MNDETKKGADGCKRACGSSSAGSGTAPSVDSSSASLAAPHVASMIVVLSCIFCSATEATPGHASALGNVADKLPTGWTSASSRPDAGERWLSVRRMLWGVCPACHGA